MVSGYKTINGNTLYFMDSRAASYNADYKGRWMVGYTVIADKTFYLKEGRWVDSSIDAETEKSAKPIQVVQFSDEYFNLVATNGQRFSQYLVFKEPVILEFNGKLYLIEAAK